ncbi:MAG: metal-dependent transcriptional regulator [Chitinophagaceae bacterium]|nr:MAG: metal-dependent transcriptional regulator [Chitinophagaceae bacterium]
MPSTAEENYLKAIFKLSRQNHEPISTNEIAAMMQTTASSVTDMLKKLSDKELLEYEKYKGVRLTSEGSKIAKNLVRRHRLWEVFLVDKLNFSWDEVHDIAEELEHIESDVLIERLEAFLEFPKYDPHGDPIPDAEGNIPLHTQMLLSDLKKGQKGKVMGVKDTSRDFLQYMDQLNIELGSQIKIISITEYDKSMFIQINGDKEFQISNQVSRNLYVKI